MTGRYEIVVDERSAASVVWSGAGVIGCPRAVSSVTSCRSLTQTAPDSDQ